jgi:hypothetical protein
MSLLRASGQMARRGAAGGSVATGGLPAGVVAAFGNARAARRTGSSSRTRTFQALDSLSAARTAAPMTSGAASVASMSSEHPTSAACASANLVRSLYRRWATAHASTSRSTRMSDRRTACFTPDRRSQACFVAVACRPHARRHALSRMASSGASRPWSWLLVAVLHALATDPPQSLPSFLQHAIQHKR